MKTDVAMRITAPLAIAALSYWTGGAVALGVGVTTLLAVLLVVSLQTSADWRTRRAPLAPPDPWAASARFSSGLWPIVLAGLLLRFVLVLVVNTSSLWLTFGGDAITWEMFGAIALAHWQDSSVLVPDWMKKVGEESFYAAVNAVSIAVFGSARYPLSFVNATMGVLVAWLAGRFADQLYGREVGRRTFLWVLFYPSLLLWSTMNIREVWAHAALLTVLIAAHNAKTRFAPLSLVLLLASLGLIYLIRPYLLPLVFLAVLVSMVFVRLRDIPFALLGFAVLVAILNAYGTNLGLTSKLLSQETLSEVQELRRGLAYGGSAYGGEVDTSTWAGSLAYLPEGIARFLFAPFPWSVRSWQQLLALPESLLFAALTYQAFRQAAGDLRRQLSKVLLPVAAFILMVCAYGLTSGNEGTAFRHRAQVVLIVLVFASARQAALSADRTSSSPKSDEKYGLTRAVIS